MVRRLLLAWGLSRFTTMSTNQNFDPGPQAIREELDRILQSPVFTRAGRVGWILRQIVEMSLDGKGDEISEKTLAADLSGHPEAFTEVATSQIRTTILRLRQRLDVYYRGAGREDAVRILVPKGSYAPVFLPGEQAPDGGPAPIPLMPPLSTNVDARRLYLEGRLYLQRQAGPKLWTALDYFRQASVLDPGYAPALSGMADCHFLLAVMGIVSGSEAFKEAAPLLERAVRIDPSCGDAWASMGTVQGVLGWAWKAAGRSFARAMELSPDLTGVLMKYSSYYLVLHGRFDEAQNAMREATERWPNSPRVNLHYVLVSYCRGDFEEARAHCLQVLQTAPRSEPFQMWLGRICCAMGDFKQAIIHFRAASRLKYSRHLIGWAGYSYARLGREREARRIFDTLTTRPAYGPVPDYILAIYYLGAGDIEKCLDYLKASMESRSPWAPLLLAVDPLFKEVRRHPRAIALAKEMGLPFAVRA